MIKKVHYCWFGGKLPANVAANIAAWKRLNPDFEFCEWHEGNTDISSYAFGRRALEQKRWGFVADIVRLQKLQAEGGVYLDTDVELIRPLQMLADEGEYLVLGYIYNCALGTAVIYSPPEHPVVRALLAEYHHIRDAAWPVNNTIFTDYFINRIPGFLLNGRRWKSARDKISLYPKEFFEQPTLIRGRGLAIHHCSGSWMAKNVGAAFKANGGGTAHQVKWLKRQLRTWVACWHSEFREVYQQAQHGRRHPKVSGWRDDNENTGK